MYLGPELHKKLKKTHKPTQKKKKQMHWVIFFRKSL